MENPTKNYCLRIWGDYGCFTRPEMKIERVSYDVITPAAVRAIFTAIFWKPAIRWHVTRIEVLKPITFTSIRRNEVAALASPKAKAIFIEEKRQQKASIILQDIAYRIFADLEYLPPEQRPQFNADAASGPETPEKYFAMFERRAAKGQTFHQPYFGCREFPVNFEFLANAAIDEDRTRHPALDASRDQDFNFMHYDFDFADTEHPQQLLFRPVMKSGVIEVPPENSSEVFR